MGLLLNHYQTGGAEGTADHVTRAMFFSSFRSACVYLTFHWSARKVSFRWIVFNVKRLKIGFFYFILPESNAFFRYNS